MESIPEIVGYWDPREFHPIINSVLKNVLLLFLY